MAKKQKKKSNPERFAVALPLRGVNVRSYDSMKKFGITIASSSREAVTHLISRQKMPTGLIMHKLDFLANSGAEDYAFKIPDFNYDSRGNPMPLEHIHIAEEIEVCMYLKFCYGGNAIRFLDRVLEELYPSV